MAYIYDHDVLDMKQYATRSEARIMSNQKVFKPKEAEREYQNSPKKNPTLHVPELPQSPLHYLKKQY